MISRSRSGCMRLMVILDDPTATLDGLRKAATTLEETEQTARRVLGSAHPLAKIIGHSREPRPRPLRKNGS